MMIKEVGTALSDMENGLNAVYYGSIRRKRERGDRRTTLRRNRVFLYKMQNNGQQKKNSSVLRLQTPREREKKTDRRIYLPITSDLHWVSSPPPPLRLLRRLLSSWESQPPEEFFRLFQKEFHWQLKLKVLTKTASGTPFVRLPSQLTLTSRSNLDLMGNILCFVQFLSLSFRVQNIPWLLQNVISKVCEMSYWNEAI